MEAYVVISLCVFTYLSFKYVQFGIRSGEVSPGMEIPMWWVTLPVFISALFMTIYNLKTLVTSIKELIQWKS
jgi:TRAP-type C4-dicarboxylate transport system permease small subunit